MRSRRNSIWAALAVAAALSAPATAQDDTEGFPVGKVPRQVYENDAKGVYSGIFGWDGDKDAALAAEDGSFTIRGNRKSIIGFNIFGKPSPPKKFRWYNHSGYLPCLVTEFERDKVLIKIMNFADKVTLDGHDYVIAYSRVSATNQGSAEATVKPGQSVAFIPLNEPEGPAKKGDTVNYDFAVAIDRFGNDYPWPKLDQLRQAGGWDEHFSHMKEYWDGKLAEVAEISTPDADLNNAIKAGFIYTHIVKDGHSTHVGENGYDRVYDHDAIGVLAGLLTIGYFSEAKELLPRLPFGKQYDDATWKYPWPWALYLLKTDDVEFVRSHWDKIKEAAHKISGDRTGPGKIMKKTNDIDANGLWTVDNWSGMTGILAYRYVAGRLGEDGERTWADGEYKDFLDAVDRTLAGTIQKNRLDYMPASMVEPNDNNRTKDPKDANWAVHFFFGRWAWDGWLLGGEQRGVGIDMIDATYDYGFKRLKKAGLPPATFGGFPGGAIKRPYSTVYNAALCASALRGKEYRSLGIQAYQFMIANTQSGPFSWWENIGVPGPSGWEGTHPEYGHGCCPGMWGQNSATKVVAESIVAEFYDGKVLVGRGIPDEWLAKGKKIEVKNFPISHKRRLNVLIEPASAHEVTLTLSGDTPAGDVIFNLPAFVGRVKSASTGKVDKKEGTVTLPADTKTVTVQM